MSLAFCLVGASALLVALSLGPRLHTRGGRTGWWGLLVIGTAFFISAIFPPVQTLAIGYLHGMSAVVVIFGSPIAFTFIDRSLARSEPQLLLPNRLRWATLLAWGGLLWGRCRPSIARGIIDPRCCATDCGNHSQVAVIVRKGRSHQWSAKITAAKHRANPKCLIPTLARHHCLSQKDHYLSAFLLQQFAAF